MELPHIGEHCGLKSCSRLDFLPVKCGDCKAVFCGAHFPRDEHNCAAVSTSDVRVPVCPLCDKPVPVVKKGDLPDLAVSRHIDNDCQSDPARDRRKKVFDKRCAVKKCKKKEMIQLKCAECDGNVN